MRITCFHIYWHRLGEAAASGVAGWPPKGTTNVAHAFRVPEGLGEGEVHVSNDVEHTDNTVGTDTISCAVSASMHVVHTSIANVIREGSSHAQN